MLKAFGGISVMILQVNFRYTKVKGVPVMKRLLNLKRPSDKSSGKIE